MSAPVAIVGKDAPQPLKRDKARPFCTEEGELASRHAPVQCTSSIGDDFGSTLDLATLLDGSPASDALLRDLAIRVSERGVAFFREQSITWEQQKELVVRMAHLTGSPESSHLHVHPVAQSDGGKKFEVSSKTIEEHGATIFPNLFANHYWHVDATFEHVAPAYSCLKLNVVPEGGGGDTLWCSLFDCVDKLSPSFVSYLETLTATHDASWYRSFAQQANINIATNRGSPENSDTSLRAVHPVIATHPVTGWKVLNVNRAYTKHINGLTAQESDALLEYLYRIISDNHDIQVRYRWESGSVALWDNRSTAHCVTNDYHGKTRYGARTLSIGEKWTVDPSSLTKAQAVKAAKERAAEREKCEEMVNGSGHANGHGTTVHR